MDFLIWQLADSGFPAGGFAHSGGLEASLQHGEVATADELWWFVCDVLVQAGHGALPLVTAAHAGEDLAELDLLCDAFLSNPVGNRASRAQGHSILSTCGRSFPRVVSAPIQESIRRRAACGHHAPIFGELLRILGIDRRQAQRLFLYLASRGVVSAGVRLGVIGSYEGIRLQAAIGPEIERVIERCGQLPPLDITQTAPVVDMWQATHDRLYSRLFQS
jgi:urease accessory protein